MISDHKFNNDAIKVTMGQDVVDILSDFLNDERDYDLHDKYIGKVVDNNDPDKKGRCRIRVFGVFGDEVQDNQLPWALPDPNFVGSLVGSSIIPPIGCIVSVYFERGEIYLPRFTKKVIDENHLPKNMGTDYPDNMIFFETDNGDRFEINRKKKTVLFEHSSGTKMEIKADGSVLVDSVKDIEQKHKLFKKDNGGFVTPGPQGPYCAIPVCPITGAQHIGQQCSPGA